MSERVTARPSEQTYAPLAAPQTGRFAWFEIVTTDPAASVEYYTKLFGWTAEAKDLGSWGTYTMLRSGDQYQAGVVPQQRTPFPAPTWLSHALTPDVDASCRRAVALGGRVIVPGTEIPGVGRLAIIADQAGAVLALYKGLRDPEPEVPDPPPGHFCYTELLTTDAPGALRFYGELFGWTHETVDLGPLGVYYLFRRGAARSAGVMQMPPDASAPPCWLPYVAVEQVDETARRAVALGGKLFVPPSDIPHVGRFSVTADPFGATIALFRRLT